MKEMPERLTKEIFHREIMSAENIVILGHVHPDGDSVGSVLGIYNYIVNVKGADAVCPVVYLDDPQDKFSYLHGFDLVRTAKDDAHYELAIVSDCADIERMGRFASYYKSAERSILIDHHVTNPGFADYCLIEGEASSASELAYTLFDEKYVDRYVAECIYTGIIHDTGVFRYATTHESTMDIAGRCMAKGIDFSSIVEDTYFSMSLTEKKILGYLLLHMGSRYDGRFVYASLDMETRKALGGADADLDGMIDKIRTTEGALMAVFIYESKDGRVKASLRSNSDEIDVSEMALRYGGGGHRRAAGCFMSDDFIKDIDELAELFGFATGIDGSH